MHDPVVLCDGHSYERRHIERWLEGENRSSPVTGAQLPSRDTFPNHALRNAIEEYFKQVFSVHRDAIRKSATELSSFSANAALLRTVGALAQESVLVNADQSAENVLNSVVLEAKQLVGAEGKAMLQRS